MIKEKMHRITLRGIDKNTKNAIKRIAKKNGRSVNFEVISLIKEKVNNDAKEAVSN